MIATILVFLIAVAVGVSLLLLIRRRLFQKSPAAAAAASIAVVASTLWIAGESMGLAVMKLMPAVLMASCFVGAIFPQPKPWAPSSVLRGLAIATGCIALVSAVSANYVVTVLALIATGALIVLFANLAPTRPSRAEEPPRASAV